MIKKAISIATLLLLVLVIVLAASIGSAKASAGSVRLHAHELRALSMNTLGSLRSRLHLDGASLDSTLAGLERQTLLTASVRGVLRHESLSAALRHDLALGQRVYTLGPLVSLSSDYA